MAVRPLEGVTIVDIGVGLAPAIAAMLMAEAGAAVVRFEPPGGDPFREAYPAYDCWHRAAETRPFSPAALAEAAAHADICILGGEDHPELEWHHDADAIAALSDRLIVLDFAAAPRGWGKPDFPAVEILAQARSGFVFTHYADRPLHFALPVAGYGAALQGTIGALAALWARDAGDGRGEIVRTSLLQGVLRWAASIWIGAERPSSRFDTLSPKGVLPMRFRCSDGLYVALAPGVPGALATLYKILGIDDPTMKQGQRHNPSGSDPRKYFADIDLIQSYVGDWTRAALLAAVDAHGLPGAPVLAAGEAWDDEQAAANDLIGYTADGTSHVALPIRIETAPPGPNPDAIRPAPRRAGPLAGVRIVDLGSFAAGPHASVVLGDLGAEVIKIERPDGDPMRGQFHHYHASNRGKRSIAIDAKEPAGAALIATLCASADVVHHNFRPGVSARLGQDHKALAVRHPNIIVLESPAYGFTGPKARLPGFDSVFQAITGHQPGAGGIGNPPLSYRFAPIDYSTGVLGALGIVLALLMKQRHGNGAALFGSLLGSGMFLLSELVRAPDGGFAGAPINRASQLGLSPAEALYRTRDGWIAIAARGQEMADRLARAAGFAPRVVTAWNDNEETAIAALTGAISTEDALALLRSANVWAEPCAADVDVVLDDPAMERLGILLVRDDPDCGRFAQVGRAVTFAHREPTLEGLAEIDPIGGHSREILEEIGFGQTEIDRLIAARVVV